MKMMNYREVKCSDRLPDKEWFGMFILRTNEEDEYGWGDYWGFTANLNLGYICIWLEPYELPTEEEIMEKLEALYLTAKRPLHRIAAKAITNLLKGERCQD